MPKGTSYLFLNLSELQSHHGVLLNHCREMCCGCSKVIHTDWLKRTRAASQVPEKKSFKCLFGVPIDDNKIETLNQVLALTNDLFPEESHQ